MTRAPRAKRSLGPKEQSTQRQLATIRSVFDRIELSYLESYDAKTEMSFFTIQTGTSELESLGLVHVPGLLVGYATFGVRPPASRRREVERFALRFNAGAHHGCVVVRADNRVVYRVSIDYTKVKDLEPGYVAGLLEVILDAIPTIDLPLIQIAKGMPADEAIAQILDLQEVTIAPPSAKRSAAKRATKKRPPRDPSTTRTSRRKA